MVDLMNGWPSATNQLAMAGAIHVSWVNCHVILGPGLFLASPTISSLINRRPRTQEGKSINLIFTIMV